MASDERDLVIDPTGLSGAAHELVKRVADAVGGFARPFQIKRIARAEAEALVIRTEAELEVDDIRRRALRRFLDEEVAHQRNMESVTEAALKHVTEAANAQRIGQDWLVNFFDKARLISEGDMQELWARVLAGESNGAGSFSRRTVNILGDMDATDAELFKTLCSFTWDVGGTIQPLIFDASHELFKRHGLKFVDIQHLASLGLIAFSPTGGYRMIEMEGEVTARYWENDLQLFPGAGGGFDVGQVIMTRAGLDLAAIVDTTEVPDHVPYVREQWSKILAKNPDPDVPPDSAASGA